MILHATTGRIKSIRAKGSRTGLGIRKSHIRKWLMNLFIFLQAGSEFEPDCFIWQLIYLSPTQRNLLSHHQLVMMAKCVPGNGPCRERRLWVGLSPELMGSSSWCVGMELLIKIHHVHLQLAGVPWHPALPAGESAGWELQQQNKPGVLPCSWKKTKPWNQCVQLCTAPFVTLFLSISSKPELG